MGRTSRGLTRPSRGLAPTPRAPVWFPRAWLTRHPSAPFSSSPGLLYLGSLQKQTQICSWQKMTLPWTSNTSKSLVRVWTFGSSEVFQKNFCKIYFFFIDRCVCYAKPTTIEGFFEEFFSLNIFHFCRTFNGMISIEYSNTTRCLKSPNWLASLYQCRQMWTARVYSSWKILWKIFSWKYFCFCASEWFTCDLGSSARASV